MKTLSETWFASGYIDFELKKYTLLAYLQEVNKCFTENKLYPPLGDLVFHYNNLQLFKKSKSDLQSRFPKELTGVNWTQLQLIYQQMLEDDELMEELESIIQYAAGKMKNTIVNGTEIYEFVEQNISIEPIGLLSLENKEGYLFVKNGEQSDTHVFEYHLSLFESHSEKYRSIKTRHLGSWPQKIHNTYNSIKAEIIKQRKALPQPATYAIQSNLNFPFTETFFPVAKRRFVRFLMED